MKINLDTPIILNPQNSSQTKSVKEVALAALFTAPPQVIEADKAKQLHKQISEQKTQITLPSDDVTKLKNAVDATHMRGVSWQFADLVDPQ